MYLGLFELVQGSDQLVFAGELELFSLDELAHVLRPEAKVMRNAAADTSSGRTAYHSFVSDRLVTLPAVGRSSAGVH
jgi:hypothetical protein